MKKLCFFIFFLIASLDSYSQIISTLSADFASSVPSLDMFLSRFNGTKHNPNALKYFNGEELRKADIALLFDFNYLSLNNMAKQQAVEFAEYAADNDIKLSLLDSLFFIEVQCPVVYKCKNNFISLTIQAKSTSATTYKWVIVDVRGDMLELAKRDSIHMIYPHEHSLNFMKMISLLESNPSTITSLVADDCSPDAMTSLCTLVNEKVLVLNPISFDGMKFHFLQVPGYVFTVERQFRDGGNSGWLINNLVQCSDEQKQDYVNRLTPHRIKTNDVQTTPQSADAEMLRVRHIVHDYYDMLNGYLAYCRGDSLMALSNETRKIINLFETPTQKIFNDLPNYQRKIEYGDSISLSDYIYELGQIAKNSNVSISSTVNEVVRITDSSIIKGRAYQVSIYKMVSIDGDVTCHTEFMIYNVDIGKLSFYQHN